MIITHIGGPTVLIEVDGWALLTDPTFDPAGGHYAFGWGTSSDKVAAQRCAVAELPPIDAVLLTHDHHGDNLDRAGRELLKSVPAVLTTQSGARRLAMPGVRGLAAGDATRLTATTARSTSLRPLHGTDHRFRGPSSATWWASRCAGPAVTNLPLDHRRHRLVSPACVRSPSACRSRSRSSTPVACGSRSPVHCATR